MMMILKQMKNNKIIMSYIQAINILCIFIQFIVSSFNILKIIKQTPINIIYYLFVNQL